MNPQEPPFIHTGLELKLQERLTAALSLISNLSKEDVLRCDIKCLTELVTEFVVAPPLLLLDSMAADKEVREVVDITFERKTGQTNHSFFIPVEGEAQWLEEVGSQRIAIDNYPLAFLDRKRPRINIRLMLSPEDEEGTLKRKLNYRVSLVEQYADSVASKLIEFNKDLAEKILAEFNKRKRAIVKAEKELENVGLPRVHNPEHEETAIQIERLMRSLGAYVTDAHTQQVSDSPQVRPRSSNNNQLTYAEQLYDKVKELIQNTKPLDEYTARIIVEYADDAIKEYGNTNQEKKVELKHWKTQAELVLPPSTIEELRKRAEGQLLKKSYPQNATLRNILLFAIAVGIVGGGLLVLKSTFSGQNDGASAEISPTPFLKPSISPTTTPVEVFSSPTPNELVTNNSSNIAKPQSSRTPEVSATTNLQNITQISNLTSSVWTTDVEKPPFSKFTLLENSVTWEVHTKTEVVAIYRGTWTLEGNIITMKFPKQRGKVAGIISSDAEIIGTIIGNTIEGIMRWTEESVPASKPYVITKIQ